MFSQRNNETRVSERFQLWNSYLCLVGKIEHPVKVTDFLNSCDKNDADLFRHVAIGIEFKKMYSAESYFFFIDACLCLYEMFYAKVLNLVLTKHYLIVLILNKPMDI